MGELASVRIHDGAADGQPQPRAVRLGGEERVEEIRQRHRLEARPIVAHREFHAVGRVPGAHFDFAPRGTGLVNRIDAVADEVDQHLLQLHGVGHHLRHVGRDFEDQAHVAGARIRSRPVTSRR